MSGPPPTQRLSTLHRLDSTPPNNTQASSLDRSRYKIQLLEQANKPLTAVLHKTRAPVPRCDQQSSQTKHKRNKTGNADSAALSLCAQLQKPHSDRSGTATRVEQKPPAPPAGAGGGRDHALGGVKPHKRRGVMGCWPSTQNKVTRAAGRQGPAARARRRLNKWLRHRCVAVPPPRAAPQVCRPWPSRPLHPQSRPFPHAQEPAADARARVCSVATAHAMHVQMVSWRHGAGYGCSVSAAQSTPHRAYSLYTRSCVVCSPCRRSG